MIIQAVTSDSATFRASRKFTCAMMFFFAPFAILTMSGRADALITVSGIERASVVDTVTSTTSASTITVYGGLAGDTDRCEGTTATSTSSTCNNCRLKDGETAAGDSLLLPCNERRINPSLQLAITFSSDSTAGTAAITEKGGGTALTATSGSGTALAKGQSVTILIPWSTVCTSIFEESGDTGDKALCLPASGKASGVIRVGVSTGTTQLLNGAADDVKDINIVILSSPSNFATDCASAGSTWQICYFEMAPGDGKAIAKTLVATDVSFPTSTFRYVRFLFATGGYDKVTLASDHRDLAITGSDTTTFNVSRRIEGLSNDVEYFFKTALVDMAGNVGFYSPAANDTDCSKAAVATTTCRQTMPSEVVGVLDKTNCFIATAAYGSQFATEIDTLRNFRDQILMASELGRRFVRFYYDNSPRYAQMIAESPVARATVRVGLLPVVWFAGMVLAYGPLKAGLALLASLIVIVALISLGRRPALRDAALEGFNDIKERARRSLLPLLIGALLVPSIAPHPVEAATKKNPTLVALEDTEDTENSASIIDPLEDEAPPEPEYPYPGAQGSAKPETILDELPEAAPTPAPRKTTGNSSQQSASRLSPLERAEKRFGTERPRRITDDGEYLYESLPDNSTKQHGSAKKHTFSKRAGVERPASIATDGEFTYPVEVSPFSGAAGIRFGMLGAPGMQNQTNGVTFKQMYGEFEIPGLLVEYEYPLTQAIGRIGIKFESGAYYAQANGRFLRSDRSTEIPEERFTFLMVPLQAVVHYRFQFWDAQWIVPFAEGGAAYNAIAELRDDGKTPRVGGAPALVVSGGVNILLDWVDQHSIRQLDAEYGINHVWLTAQYRQIFGLKKEIDLSTHLISAGFTFDF